MKFTDGSVAGAMCPTGRKDRLFFDDTLPGFGLRVTAAGKRVFIFQYNVGTKKRRTTLGTFGSEMTTAQARRKAEAMRGQVRDRRDPIAERKLAQAATLEAESKARAAAASAAYTVGVLIKDWNEHHLSARSESYRRRVPIELRRALRPWLAAPADAFVRNDAVRMLDMVKTVNGPVAGNRLRAAARACWAWAVKRGTLTVNPWEMTPRPLAKETARERVLTDSELGAVYVAAGKLSEPWGTLVRLLILTGQRRGEVVGMRWDELDLDRGIWSLPGVRTKNGRHHVVPLTPEAVSLLRTVKRRFDARLVFEGPRETAFSGFGRLKEKLDAALNSSFEGTGGKIAPWTLHDLRRTLATGMQRLGVRLEVTEALLNHVSGSRSGIVGIYQRYAWESEKANAMRSWTENVLRAVEGNVDTRGVVLLRGSR